MRRTSWTQPAPILCVAPQIGALSLHLSTGAVYGQPVPAMCNCSQGTSVQPANGGCVHCLQITRVPRDFMKVLLSDKIQGPFYIKC